jgi:hypothetical protein
MSNFAPARFADNRSCSNDRSISAGSSFCRPSFLRSRAIPLIFTIFSRFRVGCHQFFHFRERLKTASVRSDDRIEIGRFVVIPPLLLSPH